VLSKSFSGGFGSTKQGFLSTLMRVSGCRELMVHRVELTNTFMLSYRGRDSDDEWERKGAGNYLT